MSPASFLAWPGGMWLFRPSAFPGGTCPSSACTGGCGVSGGRVVGAETPEPDPEPVPPPVLGGAPDFVGGAPDCPPVGLGFFPVRETGWGAGWVAAAAGAATVAPEAGAARVGAAPPCRATCVLECRPAVWGAVTTIFVDGCDSNPGTAARGNRGPPESTRRASAA